MNILIGIVADTLVFLAYTMGLRFGWNLAVVPLGVEALTFGHAAILWCLINLIVVTPINMTTMLSKYTQAERDAPEAKLGTALGVCLVSALACASMYLFGLGLK